MLAIFIRLRVGIPVVLMGECGYLSLSLSISLLYTHSFFTSLAYSLFQYLSLSLMRRCGKTALLKYLCSWLGMPLLVLDAISMEIRVKAGGK